MVLFLCLWFSACRSNLQFGHGLYFVLLWLSTAVECFKVSGAGVSGGRPVGCRGAGSGLKLMLLMVSIGLYVCQFLL